MNDGGWYLNGWDNGDSFFVWAFRLTLTKLDDMGQIHLKTGQRYRLKDLFCGH